MTSASFDQVCPIQRGKKGGAEINPTKGDFWYPPFLLCNKHRNVLIGCVVSTGIAKLFSLPKGTMRGVHFSVNVDYFGTHRLAVYYDEVMLVYQLWVCYLLIHC